MIFFALCAGEAALFLALLSLYRAATKPDIWAWLISTPGMLFVCLSIIFISSFGWVIHTLKTCAPSNKRHVFMAVGMNLVMLVLTLGNTELLARVLSKQTAAGETVLGVLLYPKEWSKFAAHYKKRIDEMTRKGSFATYDRILGWTVTPSYIDRTGQYLSSVEGLRAPRAGMSFADPRTRHSGVSETPAAVRIALIGDSMTYGHEVRCEDSWGHVLEGLLQPHIQVLNFAINAYGLNQALLRYEKDARLWKPQIVIIGISTAMITRNNNIYPFLKDTEWGFPFARPRFVMQHNALTTMNHPVPDPGQIFANTAISELPSLDLDDYYRPYQWERGRMWYLLERSYVFRLAYSLRPPNDYGQEERNQKAMQVGQFVVQRLVREVLEDGAVPLVIYLPYELELRTKPETKYGPLSARMLRNASLEYFDPTACLIEVGVSEGYMKEGHYSPRANIQIARCLVPVLGEMIDGLKKNDNRAKR